MHFTKGRNMLMAIGPPSPGIGSPDLSRSSFPGAILVVQSLDYESCRDYFLTVEARDGGTPPLSAVTTVNVNITDVNDNAPLFSCRLYAAVVSEDAAVGDSVLQVCFDRSFASFGDF